MNQDKTTDPHGLQKLVAAGITAAGVIGLRNPKKVYAFTRKFVSNRAAHLRRLYIAAKRDGNNRKAKRLRHRLEEIGAFVPPVAV